MNTNALSALSVALNQRIGEVIDLSHQQEQESINMHTMAFLAGALQECRIYAKHGFEGVELSLYEMMHPATSQFFNISVPCNDNCQPVLPTWFNKKKLQKSIVIQQLTRRGFDVLTFIDNDNQHDALFSVHWKSRTESKSEIETRRQCGTEKFERTFLELPTALRNISGFCNSCRITHNFKYCGQFQNDDDKDQK